MATPIPAPAPGTPASTITREAFGYVDQAPGAESCATCSHFSEGSCGLYTELNSKAPQVFALDPMVAPEAYCRAWSGGGAEMAEDEEDRSEMLSMLGGPRARG